MPRIGFISGTGLQHLAPFRGLRPQNLETDFGTATVLVSDTLAYVPRHGVTPNDYVLPHRINHAANLKALKDLGCSEVVGLNSTGSLKRHLPPGTIVVPHDFIELYGTSTIFSNRPVHVVPGLDEPLRRRLIDSARTAGIPVIEAQAMFQCVTRCSASMTMVGTGSPSMICESSNCISRCTSSERRRSVRS